ncbi:aminotransferase class I/II-fold pyridoxal phosphate-dependent enzyme [Thiocapsa sp.]|uniref:aminotransferase class I/II-fold pyridoxal phosphate-dependent enzyme n=1 Tax=Thiocapsa sp. TaxID=2024551 RepID=UPI0025E8DEFD|nr:aminotransferase class I/II-fold pyridoxal phosphate-dependent enzyme [Thiocapsa sp.]
MADFTSALYLGLQHPSGALRPWERLSQGRPAALEEPPGAAAVAAELAGLQGCAAAVLLPSTLHLFLDLGELLAEGLRAIYCDAGSYPIARWGAERAALRGIPLHTFAHHNADALRQVLERTSASKRSPVVVTDGLCTVCGRSAPLADYLALVRHYGGLLVIDDTQALGVLGTTPGPGAPYGHGGGGSARLAALTGSDLLLGSSLAKGFGVPVAVLSGGASLIRRFREHSPSRLHCSPPSAAVIRAAGHALAVNGEAGDALRLRLAQRVAQFRQGLDALGLAADGGLFPVQVLKPSRGMDALRLHRLLRHQGIRSVPMRGHGRGEPRLGFLITARHEPEQIDACLAALAAALGPTRRQPTERMSHQRPDQSPAKSLWR